MRKLRLAEPSSDVWFKGNIPIVNMRVVEISNKMIHRVEVPNNYTDEHYKSMIKDHNNGERNLLS